jgi:glycosyltransferase involved in cell wall biosynthesis
MKTVLLSAPVLVSSGYSVHARQVARFLLENMPAQNISIDPVRWGNCSWIIDENRYNGLIGKIMQRTGPLEKKADVQISLKLPNEVDFTKADKNILISAMVETDKCNPKWVEEANKMDLVIAPSKHALESLTNTGNLITRSCVIPESFPDCLSNGTYKIPDLNFETDFNFLLVAQLTSTDAFEDRKNILFTIKWLCELFANNKDVGIVLKTNGSSSSIIDRNYCEVVVKQLLSEVRKGPYPKLHFLHGDMTEEEVCGLYNHPKIKALVCASRGEGFNLPALEAAASGLPVIATGWSAHTEFLNLGKYIKFDYKLVNVPQKKIDNHIFMPGSKWAEVDEQDFKRKIGKFKESFNTPKEWAMDLQKKIHQKYSFSEISKQYKQILSEYL